MNIDLTKLDEPFVLENKTDEIVAIRHYRVNFVEKLLPGQTIEITPKFAEELAYYKAGAHDRFWKRWYPDGKKALEGYYKNGRENGIWKKWMGFVREKNLI